MLVLRVFERANLVRFGKPQRGSGYDVLRQFLADHASLGEKALYDVFAQRPHLSAPLASSNPHLIRYDLLAYQYDILGDFTCDTAVGDSVTKSYSFVKFEDAAKELGRETVS